MSSPNEVEHLKNLVKLTESEVRELTKAVHELSDDLLNLTRWAHKEIYQLKEQAGLLK